MKANPRFILLVLFAGNLSACARDTPPADQSPLRVVSPAANTAQPQTAASLKVSSTAFTEGSAIPLKYTCSGVDVSPPLSWNAPPAKTESFALVVEDPDAPDGIFTHWVLFNLPSNVRSLPEHIGGSPELEDGAEQGINDFHTAGYSGPCPPKGKAHRYYFRLYALDQKLHLPPHSNRQELLQAMDRHILAEGALMGRYQKL